MTFLLSFTGTSSSLGHFGQAFLKGRSGSRLSNNVKMTNLQAIEPRKIAHQVVTVTEHIGQEIQKDLHSIANENKEATRFAEVWMAEGIDAATKTRKLTRYSENNNTPYRSRNFVEFSTLVTNLAIDLAKASYTKEKESYAKFLDAYMAEFIEEHESKDPGERLLSESYEARRLIEKVSARFLFVKAAASLCILGYSSSTPG